MVCESSETDIGSGQANIYLIFYGKDIKMVCHDLCVNNKNWIPLNDRTAI